MITEEKRAAIMGRGALHRAEDMLAELDAFDDPAMRVAWMARLILGYEDIFPPKIESLAERYRHIRDTEGLPVRT